MSDFNDIFGYKVYKPPPETEIPYVEDLNLIGEVITLIDPGADVIKDPSVQKILRNLDGERTVKIEDLPPDVRYQDWNKKALFNKEVIARQGNNRSNLQPQLPLMQHNMLKEDKNSQHYSNEGIRQAQMKAQSAKNSEMEFTRQLQETKHALEKEIHRQLVEQLTMRAQRQSVTPEQQALIEKLYLDLRLINPELAFATLQASAALNEPQQQVPHRAVQQRQAPQAPKPAARGPPQQMIQNQGIVEQSSRHKSSSSSAKKSSSKSKSSRK